MVIVAVAVGVSLWNSKPVQAASILNSCMNCHGMPPRDGARKANPHFDSNSSAFSGNHARHLPAASTTASCNVCHVPVAATNFGHQSGVINMAYSLKGYSSPTVRAKYDKGVFFNQTSLPNLVNARCSNTSCHFETQTPVWGSADFVAPANCNACHGAPPAGTVGAPAGGIAGSHARHDTYFPGVDNCQKCHANSTTFTHATSAGRPLKVQGFLRDPLNTLEATGRYTGAGLNYLPSKSGAPGFGVCSNLYCHSSAQGTAGTGTITYQSPTWGGAALSCGGCHQNMGPAANSNATGSHAAHAQTAAVACGVCHGVTYTSTSVPTGAGTTHVDKRINLNFTGTATGTTYGKSTNFAPGTAYTTCSATVCHGQGAPTWGATSAVPINGFPYSAAQCGKCHSESGTVTASAPFYSTAIPKVTLNTNAKVGAHTAHLASVDTLHPALACADCHGVVALNDPTHMNGSTTFNWSALAKTGNLTPTYNAATGQCSNVYCHGGAMPGGDTSGSNRAPIWYNPNYLPATLSVVGCGTCHGFPPPTSTGHPAVTLPAGFPGTVAIGGTCNCHANINPAGNSYATIFVDNTKHINGTLEGGACNACHGYPPVSATFTGAGTQNNWSSARAENYVGGGGAHSINAHVSKAAKHNDGFAFCVNCHSPADHLTTPEVYKPSSNIKVKVNQRYRFEAAKQFRYSSNRLDDAAHVTGNCTNSSCHFGASPKWDPAH